MNHFQNLNIDQELQVEPNLKLPELENDYINQDFSVNEIKKAINKLKNKITGSDHVLNEYFKYSMSALVHVITKLFNLILKTGLFPDVWTTGSIVPIFKNKGSVHEPDNYRGIAILSCFGKLFTSVLNQRLSDYLDNFGLLDEEQAGFRGGYSTVDHIFALKIIIDIYLNKNKDLYVAFVDYQKAFDSIWRVGLWQKLLRHNINGKILNVIINLYSNIKSCVKLNGVFSKTFGCNIGLRQGEYLSPLLFSLFLNDMSEFLSHSYNGLSYLHDLILEKLETDDTVMFFRLFLLLYADDTILLAETGQELQAALNALGHYCKIWKLKVNVSKSKVMVFNKKLKVESIGSNFLV